MRIEIDIPKEFEEHFNQDKFKDSLERIMADIKHSLESGYWLCAGRYEYETIEMLQKAFEDSKQAYDIDKVVEELPDDVCEWEKGSSGYVGYRAYYSKCCATRSGLEMQTHIIADWKYCPYCGKKIKVVEQMDEEEYRYCHKDEHIDEYHDCLDYMECEECPYYYANEDQDGD